MVNENCLPLRHCLPYPCTPRLLLLQGTVVHQELDLRHRIIEPTSRKWLSHPVQPALLLLIPVLANPPSPLLLLKDRNHPRLPPRNAYSTSSHPLRIVWWL